MPPAPDESQRAPRARSVLADPPATAVAATSAAAPVPRGSYAALWRARLELMRPGNCLMAAVGVLVGLAVTAGLPDWGDRAAAGVWVAAPAAAFLVAAFGNVLNDLADHRLDALAHPHRPLPAGRIGRREAQLTAGFFLALGLWEAFVAGGAALLAFAAATAAALAAYEAWFKGLGLPGNVLVAALVSATFAFGALAGGTPVAEWGLLWLLMAMAFLANVARELLKDVEDMDADRGHRSTLPLQAGAGVARLLAFALVNVAVLLSVLAFLDPPESWWLPWLGLLAAADLLFVLAASFAWLDVGRAQRLLKLAMLAALAAFLAGPLVP